MDWRRQWKPDIESVAWQPFQVNGCSSICLMKTFFSSSSYHLMWFYNSALYECEASGNDILKQSKASNPNLEAPLNTILNHVRTVVTQEKNEEVTFKLVQENEELRVTFISSLAGVKFVWCFLAHKISDVKINQLLITPLLAMVGELDHQKTELEKLLYKKDAEINDFTAQGLQLSKRSLHTAAFDQKAFLNELLTSQRFQDFVAAGGTDALQKADVKQLYTEIMLKQQWLRSVEENKNKTITENDVGPNEALHKHVGTSWDAERLPPSLETSLEMQTVSPEINSSLGLNKQLEVTEELKRRNELEEKLAKDEEKKRKKQKKKIVF